MTFVPATPVSRFLRDDIGQDLIEYALLASFVSLIAIVGATFLGSALQNWYTQTGSRVNSAAS